MTTCELLDVSGNNPSDIDFAKVRAAGVVGVYVKLTEGVHYLDPHALRYEPLLKAAGLPFGGYHYLRIRSGTPQDAKEQAIEFCNALRASGATLPAAVDVELAENEAATHDEVHQAVTDFRAAFVEEMGYEPVIYTSHGEWTAWGISMTGDPSFATSDLWLADYETTPHPPSPWTSCVLHQYTGSGMCDGVPGKVDHSRFQGDEAAFRVWAGLPSACSQTDPAPSAA